MTTTIDAAEVKKFSDIADEWWSETGKFKPLHKFNPVRISYIRNKIIEHFNNRKSTRALENKDFEAIDKNSLTPFSQLKIIDIGCGGGLISEPFARMGASVTGIDASEKNIAVAKIHAEKSALNIDYRATSVEALNLANQACASDDENSTTKDSDKFVAAKNKFDVVFALEIIEHVANVDEFVKGCAQLLEDDGIMFIATLNRTVKSLLMAKIGAEYVLRWLPIGTHSWEKFLKPSEINEYAEAASLTLEQLSGFSYNLLKDEWKIDADDLEVNYIAVFTRKLN